MRRNRWWLAGGALVVGASSSLVNFAFRQVTCAKKQTSDQCLTVQEQAGVLRREELAGLPRRRLEIESSDGLQLRAWLLPGTQPVRQVIVLVHGYTQAASWMLHLAMPFWKRGWTVLLVDQRAHGSSEGRYASYGYHEKHDLHLWVNWLVEQYGDQVIVGLLGQSMGGGTVLEYATLNRQAAFIIADCAYSDLRQLIAYQIGNLHHLPVRPLLQLLERRVRQRVGFCFDDVSPVQTLKQCADLPVMFIHGGKDDFVPTEMSITMHREKPGRKRLLVIPEAGHARAYLTDREAYEREMFEFIDEVLAERRLALGAAGAAVADSEPKPLAVAPPATLASIPVITT